MSLFENFLDYIRKDKVILIKWKLGSYVDYLIEDRPERGYDYPFEEVSRHLKSFKMFELIYDNMRKKNLDMAKRLIKYTIIYGKYDIVDELLGKITFNKTVARYIIERINNAISIIDKKYYDDTNYLYMNVRNNKDMIIPEDLLIKLSKMDERSDILNLVLGTNMENCPPYKSYPFLINNFYKLNSSKDHELKPWDFFEYFDKPEKEITNTYGEGIVENDKYYFEGPAYINSYLDKYFKRFGDVINHESILIVWNKCLDHDKQNFFRIITENIVKYNMVDLYAPIIERINKIASITLEDIGLDINDTYSTPREIRNKMEPDLNEIALLVQQQKMLADNNINFATMISYILDDPEVAVYISENPHSKMRKIGDYRLLPVTYYKDTTLYKKSIQTDEPRTYNDWVNKTEDIDRLYIGNH